MAPTRQSLRGRRASTPECDTTQHEPKTPHSVKRNSVVDNSSDTIMTSDSVLVPPSPGFFGGSLIEHSVDDPGLPARKESKVRTRTRAIPEDRTGAGVKKSQTKDKTITQKLVDAAAGAPSSLRDKAHQPFRFLDLPGEIRNLVYQLTYDHPRQALLVHRPRVSTLRTRTRLDRQRTLASDVKDKELSNELATAKCRRSSKHGSADTLARETNRPFFGLTQVCRQLRTEFRPMYLQKQEIGMDLTEIVQYLKTFYFNAPSQFAKLFADGQRGKDMPFNGNLTIAVGLKPLELEKKEEGIEIIPLLDLWANSYKVEAGFGRYLRSGYNPQGDGEAKDLYRLFGRRVLRDRSCSNMNNLWRSILRTRSLASVTLHRKPASQSVALANLPLHLARNITLARLGAMLPLPTMVTTETKPFVHILFHADRAEHWMKELESDPPKNWLADRGFGNMEHFDVKVGVAPDGFDQRS